MKSEGSMNVYFRYWTEEPLHTVNKSKFDIKLATTDTYTKYMIYADAEKKYAVQLQKKSQDATSCNFSNLNSASRVETWDEAVCWLAS
jgi:hypothetical protein